MKILQSKYYKPRQILHSTLSHPRTVSLKDETRYQIQPNPFEELLNDILSGISMYGRDIVIKKEQLTDFIRCTDFHTLAYTYKSNKLYESEACYFHPDHEVFIIVNEDLSDNYEENLFDSGVLKIAGVYYESTNENSPQNIRHIFDHYLQKYISNEAKVAILLKESDGFVFKNYQIKPMPINLDTMYPHDFLAVHQHIKDNLTNNNKGVVLLHGIAGSGKTNYIKWLTSQVPEKKFIFVPAAMITHLTNPEFMSLLIENKNSVLVLEDCENYIAERDINDTNTDVVSSILNIADGILSDVLECQFICTFNSDISKIDSALLRQGRLIAEYKFKELSTEQANAYLASIGKNFTVNKPHSLAELTNMDSVTYKEKETEKVKVGFI